MEIEERLGLFQDRTHCYQNLGGSFVLSEGNALVDYMAHVALDSPPGAHYLEFLIGECHRMLGSDHLGALSSGFSHS